MRKHFISYHQTSIQINSCYIIYIDLKPNLVINLHHTCCIYCRGDFQAYLGDSSEEEDDRRQTTSSNIKKKITTKHSKECPGCGTKLSQAIKQCPSCDYTFTSKSMLMLSSGSSGALSALEESKAIRDKFPFEPERVSYYNYIFMYT